MERAIKITIALLLLTSPIARAQDMDAPLPDPVVEHRYMNRIDMNISPRDYHKIYKQNQRVVLRNLRSYSESALESFGMSRQSAGLMGATLGVLTNEARLNLNESKTLSLEVKDVSDSDPTVYFGFNLDW